MVVIIIRLIFIAVMTILSYQLTSSIISEYQFKITFLKYISPYMGMSIGIAFALIMIMIERGIKKLPLKNIIIIILGFISGLALANLAAYSLLFFIHNEIMATFSRMFLNLLFGYLGIITAIKKHGEFAILGSNIILGSKEHIFSYKVLDTNVIIDGRIADIVESGFLEGILVIPRFVLHELHLIADSSDDLKRNRGRRGLEILNRIQKKQNLRVEINEKNFPEIKEVDEKLVLLAKSMSAFIVTNDYNLNKLAELQGVRVLNINDLANAVKPVILPGENMQLRIIKEGKEYGQGIGYLDDGTMIVIENGRKYLGQIILITVTSVLQTTAGRMIFGQFKQELKND